MILQTFVATRFEEVLGEGRTRPLLLSTHLPDYSASAGSKVVKAIGCPEVFDNWQLVCEVMGNVIARRAGIATPEPCVVDIGPEASRAINASLKSRGDKGEIVPGSASGCEYLDRFAPYSRDQRLTNDLEIQALRVYAFDFLCQNLDRRKSKVNCGIRNNQLVAFDFEMCFSHLFLTLIGQKGQPAENWVPPVDWHLFSSYFRSRPELVYRETGPLVDEMVSSIDSEWLGETVVCLPENWKTSGQRICNALLELLSDPLGLSEAVLGSLR